MARRSGARASTACACASPPTRRRSTQPAPVCGASARSCRAARGPSQPAPPLRGVAVDYIIMTTLKKPAGSAGAIMRQVRTLGLLGTGVIGGGWAARALHFGIDVLAADLNPAMQEWLRGAVAHAEGALARLTLAPLPPKGELSFTTDLPTMARQAGVVPGNNPRAVGGKGG